MRYAVRMPASSYSTLPTISAAQARLLLIQGARLLSDPARKATAASVCRCIERMGFVQVDTINIVERAHHHILMSRFDGYEKHMLTKLLEKDRKLYEHWTHDASIIPVSCRPYWHHRYKKSEKRIKENGWWYSRLGENPRKLCNHVLKRIREEGPLMSKDFEHREGGNKPWWGWKPQKAALEYLWHTGKLGVTRRVNFHKVYDLTERMFPDHDNGHRFARGEMIEWACSSALQRLGVAGSAEIKGFWDLIKPQEAKTWCEGQARKGEIVEVQVQGADGSSPKLSYALPDWKKKVKAAPPPLQRMRLLSPFDPVIRDRNRLLRLFGFDYRFEAFVPEAKRKFGYYVLPILEGDRLVGRLDPKFHRDLGTLVIRKVWWEPGIKATRKRATSLDRAVDLFARQLGAERWTIHK